MNDLSFQSLYVISLEEILWGGVLVAITMAMHGLGMLVILRASQIMKRWFRGNGSLFLTLIPVILASWMIMIMHLSEVGVWAIFFYWKGAFPNRSVAYYFSLNEYTTLGSIFKLPSHLRLLEGMIAIAGLLCFAWSTGILITLAQGFQDERLHLLQQRREKGNCEMIK